MSERTSKIEMRSYFENPHGSVMPIHFTPPDSRPDLKPWSLWLLPGASVTVLTDYEYSVEWGTP